MELDSSTEGALHTWSQCKPSFNLLNLRSNILYILQCIKPLPHVLWYDDDWKDFTWGLPVAQCGIPLSCCHVSTPRTYTCSGYLLDRPIGLVAINYESSTPQFPLDTGPKLFVLRCVYIRWLSQPALVKPNDPCTVDLEYDSPPPRRYRYARQDGLLSFQT